MIGASDIARLLADRVDHLVADLLPAGKREGAEWCVAAANSPSNCSISVHLIGNKRGLWGAWAAGRGGDALDLVTHIACNGDKKEAIRWARRWLDIDDGTTTPPRPALARETARRDDEAAARQARAIEIWRSAVENIAGTPAEVYLRSRGLDPARLFSLWGARQWPATLRYSESAAFDPARPCRALVVAVNGADCGLVRAIQRILLHPDGTPVRDENGRKKKLSLGPIAGNSARFDYWPDPEGRIGIAEGPENALAAFVLTGIPTWSAISAGNTPNIKPPDWARHVTLFADRDKAGLIAAGETMRRLRAHPEIESVRVLGALTEGGDAADVLIAGGAHAG